MLFAGDTAGKISCWDVTELLLNHIREYCDLECGKDKPMKNISEKKSGNYAGVETPVVQEEEIADKASEKTVSEGDVSLEKCDTALGSVTACHVKENVTTDSVKAVQHEDNSDASWHSCCQGGVAQDFITGCHADESVTNADKFTDSLAGNQYLFHSGHEVLNVAYTNEQTAITSETRDGDDQELNGKFVDQSDFSCLPLVPVFLDLPTHVFKAHQSGVNAVSLVKTEGKAFKIVTHCSQSPVEWTDKLAPLFKNRRGSTPKSLRCC